MDLSKLTDEQLEIALKVADEAKRQGINPDFVLPMVMQESGFKHDITSKKGAYGVMQLMPDTAKGLKVDPSNINDNIRGGISLLKELISNPKIGTDPYKVLAGYNASTDTRNKFYESGNLSDLPDETINHMVNVSNHYGGQLPTLEYSEQPSANNVAPPKADDTIKSSNDTIKSTPSQNVSPVIGGLIGATAGSTLGSGASLLKVKKDLAVKGLQMAGLINKPIEVPPITSAPNIVEPNVGAPIESSPSTPGGRYGAKTGYGVGEGTVEDVVGKHKRMAGQGKITSRLSKMYGVRKTGESPELFQRMIDRKKVAEETAKILEEAKIAENARLASQVANTSESPLWKYAKGLASYPVKGALSGLGLGFGAVDAYNRQKQGNSGEALTSGLGAISGAVAPFVGGVASPLLASVGMAAPLYLAASDRIRYLKEHPEENRLPETVNGMRFGPSGEPYGTD